VNVTQNPSPAPQDSGGRKTPVPPQSRIVCAPGPMEALVIELQRLARSSARVLITGESGVGKELVAAQIHAYSTRAERPFVALNCAGLPETLLESELFGHVKGSFTGAYRDKRGKLELAHTGTMFLDEVGEMSLRMQGLLLRVLETGELQKVGADHVDARVDCRFVAATNRNLLDLVARGDFREDLYYRLNVIHVHVPPLRERRDDIPVLADYFLRRFSEEAGVTHSFAPDVPAALRAFSWPGNVRQLENLVHRLVINAPQNVITSADLPSDVRHGTTRVVMQAPRRERRQTVASELYARIKAGESFWTVAHAPYIARDIAKSDLRELIRKALHDARGNYRTVTKLFNIEPGDYKRFLNFLRKHGCVLPYREFR
jgi:transcriptional regulator with PAS, ATPase and Fis domain